jgi:propionyl-CoA carboxylase alpha chain
MKYTVKIDNQTYDVEITDLNSRPIIATIGDEQFEVWPEASTSHTAVPIPPSARPTTPPQPPANAPSTATGERNKTVRAPIPGTVAEVLVKSSDSVTIGQPLCVLDAMKMSNTIRASRAGVISRIAITVGQHVKHNDVLVEFAE